jgi:hypothetical protein
MKKKVEITKLTNEGDYCAVCDEEDLEHLLEMIKEV